MRGVCAEIAEINGGSVEDVLDLGAELVLALRAGRDRKQKEQDKEEVSVRTFHRKVDAKKWAGLACGKSVHLTGTGCQSGRAILCRGCDDDWTAFALHKVRGEGANDLSCAGQIVIDLDLPVGIIHFQQRFESLNSCIGENDVDAVEFLFDACCGFATIPERRWGFGMVNLVVR